MQAAALIREFELHTDDLDFEDEDRLWTAEERLHYLNQAINEFVQETEVLIDSTDPMTQLALTATSPWVDYDERIIRFERLCHDLTSNRRLEIVSILNLQEHAYSNDYGITFSSPRWKTQEGVPRLLISDMQTQRLRVYPIPTVNSTIACTVRRMPLAELTQGDVDGGTSPEIPARFHRKLLVYMKLMAYSKEDGETYDDKQMVRWLAEWQETVRQCRERLERERGKRPRVTKYRDPETVAFSSEGLRYGRRAGY